MSWFKIASLCSSSCNSNATTSGTISNLSISVLRSSKKFPISASFEDLHCTSVHSLSFGHLKDQLSHIPYYQEQAFSANMTPLFFSKYIPFGSFLKQILYIKSHSMQALFNKFSSVRVQIAEQLLTS